VIKRTTSIIVPVQILLLIIGFQFLAYARAEVVSLSPIDDAYVTSLYPLVNRGSDNRLVLAKYQAKGYGSYAIDVNILVYIKFDLSNIPSSVEIVSAKLELYAVSVAMPRDIIVTHCPDNSWNEREITYSKAPKYEWRTPPISTRVSAANAWYSWDLTIDVRNALGGQLSEVLEINTYILAEKAPNHISFYSKEESDPSYRPRLSIEYSKQIGASFIACHVATETIQLGETLEVTGTISPPHSGVPVTITYKCEDGSTFTRTVLTSSDGTFSDSFTSQSSGKWSVYASWPGDEDHQGSTSEAASFFVEEKPQLTPPLPPSTMGLPIFWILVPIIALSVFAAGALYLTRSRRGALPLARRRVKPVSPKPSEVLKTSAMPEVPPAPKEKKLPEVKTIPVEALMPLDEKVYLYIVDHGGEISWSQASRDLGVSIEELKTSVERLKQAKRIE